MSVLLHRKAKFRIGIEAVCSCRPFFVVDRKYAIVGAQPPAVILQTLEKAFEGYCALREAAERFADGSSFLKQKSPTSL